MVTQREEMQNCFETAAHPHEDDSAKLIRLARVTVQFAAMKTLVIIGGGIGGLAAAACLRHRGIDAQVYERSSQLPEVGAALALWPNATRVLRHLGLLDSLVSQSHVSTSSVLHDSHGRVLKQVSWAGTDPPALFAHRADLLATLLTALPPATLSLGKTFLRTEQEGPHVRALFTDGTASPWADGLIGADGIRSAVRTQLFHDGDPLYRGYVAWRGVAQFDREVALSQTWGRGQRFGLIPIGKNRIGWWASANVANPEQTVMRDTPALWKAEVLRLTAGWHAPIPAVVEATPLDTLLCNIVHDRPAASRWSDGHITLLGDAAHPATPNLGQGACMAIEDAAVLAHAVDAIPDPASAFRVYEATRFERTRHITKESLKFGRMGQMNNAFLCSLRNTAFRFSSDRRIQKNFHDLWSYDAWTTPLMMPT
jgi:2-polyprenyl-6-methoxyphenol hydroxylase-like FAD-dependent oxidoreductase